MLASFFSKKKQDFLVLIRQSNLKDWHDLLGKDLFLLCLEYLDDSSLARCMRVCKQWKITARTDSLWYQKCMRRFPAQKPRKDTTYYEIYKKEADLGAQLEDMMKMMEDIKILTDKIHADTMVCRMFHESNGRNNFLPYTPSVPFEEMPTRETLIKILARDNEIRLSKEIQDEYWATEYPSKVTLKVQTQAVKEFGYENPWIVPSAISYYKDDPELMNIPHYVKFNRSRQGKLNCGDPIPDIMLTTTRGCATTLLREIAAQSCAGGPLVLVAGSYT
eukprot:Phypoly_transcript_07998.p1 GENE.Phypoly_transcript_07998~~Phypoly_transcript_07998.p1  ORF type:complete len:276 (+),score=32.47 Phypoly_transcript_07998:212-1039(+)